jgi:hypothetical protein
LRRWSSSSILLRKWVTGTSFLVTQPYLSYRRLLLHAQAVSAAPAASFKSAFRTGGFPSRNAKFLENGILSNLPALVPTGRGELTENPTFPAVKSDYERPDPNPSADAAKAASDALSGMYPKIPTLAPVVNGWAMNTDTMGVCGDYYFKRALVRTTSRFPARGSPIDSTQPIPNIPGRAILIPILFWCWSRRFRARLIRMDHPA